jgi:hypothetical protein
VVVSNGALSNGQVVVAAGTYEEPSFANQYDAAGNVVVRNTINGGTYTVNSGTTVKTYNAGDTLSQRLVYDARNELVESDYATDLTQHETSLGAQQKMTYDNDGHQLSDNTYLRSDSKASVYGTHDMPNGYVYIPEGGWLGYGEVSSYNADGLVSEQQSFQGPNRDWLQIANNWENNDTLPDGGQGAVPSIGSDGPLALASTTTYTSFDHADNVLTYSMASYLPGVFGANYTVNYLKKDGYLEQGTTETGVSVHFPQEASTSWVCRSWPGQRGARAAPRSPRGNVRFYTRAG